jgi:hypothetical protein
MCMVIASSLHDETNDLRAGSVAGAVRREISDRDSNLIDEFQPPAANGVPQT